jgi:hypothetical protein
LRNRKRSYLPDLTPAAPNRDWAGGVKVRIRRDANMAERVGDVDVEARLGGPGLAQPVHEPFVYRLAVLIHAGGPRLWAVGKGH